MKTNFNVLEDRYLEDVVGGAVGPGGSDVIIYENGTAVLAVDFPNTAQGVATAAQLGKDINSLGVTGVVAKVASSNPNNVRVINATNLSSQTLTYIDKLLGV